MANTEHNALTGSALHENKGAAGATDNTVATAVSGATVWAKLTASNLTTTGNSFGAQLFHIQDYTSAAAIASGGWHTLSLSNSVTNEISGASLASNTITLPTGTYYCEAFSGAQANTTTQGICQIKLYNSTSSTDTLYGITAEAINGAGVLCRAAGRFSVSGTKDFVLQMRSSSTISTGVTNSFPGSREVYREVLIWKIA